MADIFVSYARADAALVKKLVKALEAERFSVEIDSNIPSGGDWRSWIEQEITKAKAVVTVWTEASVVSTYVLDESSEALHQNKLMQLRLDDAELRIGFRSFQCADLRGFPGDRGAAGFRSLVASLRERMAEAATPVDPIFRAEFRAAIKRMDADYGYRDRTLGFLDWVERRLEGAARPGAWPPKRAFSYELLNLTLLLALAYPLLSLFAQFALTGAAKLGAFAPFAAGPDDRWARAAIGAIVILPFFAPLTRRVLRRHARRAGGGVALLFAVAVAFAGAGAGSFAGLVAFAGALAFVVAVAVAGEFTGAFTGAVAFGGAVALAVVFTGAFTGAIAVAGAVAGAVAVIIAFAVTVAGAFAVAVAGAGAVIWLGGRLGFRLVWLLAYLGAALVTLRLALGWIDALPGSTETEPDLAAEARGALIAFLVLLPAVNALFDFLSIGLTRLLLRVGAAKERLLSKLAFAALDLLIGLALFIGLGCAAIALIDAMRVGGPDGATLIDTPGLLADIRDDPAAYWWLYATFLSTLIPTMLHAVAGVAALSDHLFARGAAARAAGRLTLASSPQQMIDATAALRSTLRFSSRVGWIGGLGLVGAGVWLLFAKAGFGVFLLDFFIAFEAGALKAWLRALLAPITEWLAAP